MTEPNPRISDAEWEVMQALWEDEPRGARELAAELGPLQGWGVATVKTLLGRLVEKGALAFERDGQRYLYRTALSREACVRDRSKAFMQRVFGGRTSPLLAHFLKESKLSTEEISELRELLASRAADAESSKKEGKR